ncbi:MAG: hypothetical protein MUE98_13325 [Rhodobacteraceae bacterium]|jgi:hypothetical protein|nr:hypothetical protein [Paracoccaceae bacterium]
MAGIAEGSAGCVPGALRHNPPMQRRTSRIAAGALCALGALAAATAGAQPTVYACPGNVYTNTMSAQEARDKGCRTIDGAPITIVPGGRPRATSGAGAGAGGASGPAATPPRPAESRVDPAAQRARDADARRILTEELRREEEQLAALQKEFNNGEPERRGDERNFQRYLDRVAEMRVRIQRKESDIAAIRRELGKLPP